MALNNLGLVAHKLGDYTEAIRLHQESLVAQRNVGEMFVDKVFIGVDGVHAEHGLTTNYPDQAAIHRAMMRQARQRIIVADHRKIGIVGASVIWPASDFHVLVTDKLTSDKAIAPFTENNVKVLRA